MVVGILCKTFFTDQPSPDISSATLEGVLIVEPSLSPFPQKPVTYTGYATVVRGCGALVVDIVCVT